MKDMILEHNTFDGKKCLDKNIPSSFPDDYWGKPCEKCRCKLCPPCAVSDHRPYYVRVKNK
jgi:hypothetical protein